MSTWQAFFYGYGAKIVLPLLIPLATTALKQIIDKWTPIILSSIPKPLWAGVVLALGSIPPLVRPDAFLFPGFPPEASVAFYGLMAMGSRELVDQGIKTYTAVFGEPPPTTPTGM